MAKKVVEKKSTAKKTSAVKTSVKKQTKPAKPVAVSKSTRIRD